MDRRNTMLKERLQNQWQEVRSLLGETGGIETANSTPDVKSDDSAAENKETLPGVSGPSHEEWLKTDLFARLSQSKFRSRFHLGAADKAYVREKGMETIRDHAQELIAKRLAPAVIPNDGKQTPMKGHPVFIAQHATGTCCRNCLRKWHGIPSGRELTEQEQSLVTDVLIRWIQREMSEK